ncbi:MAG TPA: hypothetical protein VFB60_02480 [Ktedonobacteraceae bacterium]|nr:hypothetical protein [Ktedonobacteraceae bacterium]
MALTREQALQLIHESQSGTFPFYASEIRVLSLEPGILPEFHRFHDEQISLQAECWVCEYEHRQRLPDGTLLGPWSAWKKRRGYVVVPELHPFFIVEE